MEIVIKKKFNPFASLRINIVDKVKQFEES